MNVDDCSELPKTKQEKATALRLKAKDEQELQESHDIEEDMISDDEDEDFVPRSQGLSEAHGQGERQHILADQEDDDPPARASTSSDATLTRPEAEGSGDELGKWGSSRP